MKRYCFAAKTSRKFFMSKHRPIVSVVVTTFNRVEMLSQTVDSILSQSFKDLELIIVDNLSTDGTSDYIKSLDDSRIRYLKNPNYGVIAVNRNYGVLQAKGKYIAFCDDDDLWMTDKLSKQIELLNKNPDVVLTYSHAESFLGDNIVSRKMNRRTVNQNHFFQLLRGNFIPNSSVLIKRDIFNALGGLNESINLREDYEMWLRVANNYLILGTDQVLIKYRLHRNNNAGSKVAETKRAIRTLRNLKESLHIPLHLYFPSLFIHYLKYIIYLTKTLIWKI
jgi:glycosyltransferase involved in cell wall biosynthesis